MLGERAPAILAPDHDQGRAPDIREKGPGVRAREQGPDLALVQLRACPQNHLLQRTEQRAVGLAIDIYLIARVITDAPRLSAALGVAVLAMFVVLWFGFPQWRAMQARRAAPR